MPTTIRVLTALLTMTTFACSTGEVAAPPSSGQAEHCLWVVRSPSTTLYLLGSIHALTGSIEPLPAVMEEALDRADTVVFEVDMADLEAAGLTMLARGSLPEGRKLADVISPETLAMVSTRLEAAGLPEQGFDRLKPWMLALTLMSLELVKSGYDPGNGVDSTFYRLAGERGKTIETLETVDFQLSLFDGMTADQQEQFLRYTLSELDEAIPLIEKVTELWRAGRGEELADLLVDGFDDFPELQARIVTDRNHTWMEQIESYLANDQEVLMVVGALHIVGEEGLVALLEAEGYEVEQR